MTRTYTYNNIKRCMLAVAMMASAVCTWAQTNVAKIETTEYATLQAAIDAAAEGQTVTLIADISETGTYSINGKHITIDFASFTVTANHNDGSAKVFNVTSTGGLTLKGTTGGFTDDKVYGIFYNQGTLTVEGGVYSTTVDDYGVIFNEGGTCTVNGGTLTGAYAAIYAKGTNNVAVSNGTIKGAFIGIQATAGTTLNVTDGTITATNEAKKYPGLYLIGEGTTVTVSGGNISGWDGISVREKASLTVNTGATISAKNAAIIGNGNDGQGNTTITINGGTMTSNDTGIYHPQIGGQLTIKGGTISGDKLGVEIRAGELSVTGGSITSSADTYSCVANNNGTTTIGAALAIAQHTTKQNIAVTISGGEFTGVKAISESNPQNNDPAPQVTMSVTDGTFNGGITVEDVQDGFIEGGTFNQPVPEEYCAAGFIPKDNGDGTFGVKEGVYVAQIGETKYETIAEAIAAAPDATETTIVLLTDITTDFTVTEGKKIIPIIGDHTISGAITNNGTLAISDGIVSGNITNTGTLNISGGTFEGTITNTSTISITGGTFTSKPEAGWIADGYEVMVGNGKYVVAAAGTAEAKIVDAEENTTLYQTIADAIAAASTNVTTITLLKDVAAETITIPENANITLELGEVTLTKAITNSGTLTITNGTFTGTITNNGTLNITGGTFTNKPTGEYNCGDGKDLIINAEGKYVVTDITLAEAEIDGNKYLTIDKAITAAGSTATTITLLKDLGENRLVAIPEVAKITLTAANDVTLTNTIMITNNGALTIASDAIKSTITIAQFEASVKIATGVTLDNTAVALSTELSQAKNVLKSQTAGDPTITTYWVEKMFVAAVALTGEPTTKQINAAKALAANTSLIADAITGLTANQSLTITVTSVTLSGENVTKATFEVKLIGADGQEVTGTTPQITFRLPIKSSAADGAWVNLWHNTTAIPGATVVGSDYANKYVTVSTTSFSPFSYEIIENPVAQIGETKYGTVDDAITAVTSSLAEATKISLVGTENEVTEDITVTMNKNILLAVGTHTISGTLTNNGTLAIADGTISGAITNTAALAISGTANITGAISASAGTFSISGGSFSNTSTITTSGTAGLNITNGTINGAISVAGSGTNTISGGTFAEAVTATDGILTISNGIFTKDEANAIYANGGTINITGGTFSNTTDGAINVTEHTISGGTFTKAPTSTQCVVGYLPLKNSADKFEVKNHWTVVDNTNLSENPHLVNGGYSVTNATYYRNTGMVSAGNTDTTYGTICLPFAITAAVTTPSTVKLYKATGITATELTITEVTDFSSAIPAGTPLIFELSAKASSMTVTSSNATVNTTPPAIEPVTTSGSENYLVGRFTVEPPITTGLEKIYYLNGDKFHQAVQSLNVPAFRAYIVNPTTQAKPMTLSIVKEGNAPTNISEVDALETVTAVYDMNGRKQNGLQRGVNIMRRADGSTIKVILK